MTLRRGFPAEAEKLGAEVRAELKLASTDRVDPHAVAEHLEIPLVGLRHFARRDLAPGAASFFLRTDRESFSAVTIFRGRRRVIIYNDAHAAVRHTSDIAHELSHSLLEHEPHNVFTKNGKLIHDPAIEEEATSQGATLLVPRDGALELLASGLTVAQLAEHFGVSMQLASWRVNVTGVMKQLQRRARPGGRRPSAPSR